MTKRERHRPPRGAPRPLPRRHRPGRAGGRARLARPGEFSERAFLNGKLDLAQAEAIAESLRHRQVPHEYRVFEGEGHGFRMAANQKRALEAELSFYAQVFGFELADDFAPLEVSGL